MELGEGIFHELTIFRRGRMMMFRFPDGGRVAIDEETLKLLRERIVRYGQSRIGRENAEDLAQETMLLLSTKYRHIEWLEDLLPLTFKIMTYKIMDLRGSTRWKAGQMGEDVEGRETPGGERPDEVFATKEFFARFLAAVKLLGPECRRILWLRFRRKSTAEIRQRLAMVSDQAVNLKVFHCRARLRELMREAEESRP
jgi:RNA polymerase sigma factor (sigma-70 family)